MITDPLGDKGWLFLIILKVLWILTFTEKINVIGQKLRKIFQFLDLAFLIKLIMRKFFVIPYIMKGLSWEAEIMDSEWPY